MVKLTTEVNEEAFVIALQHGDNDVTCKRSLAEQRGGYAGTNCFLPFFFLRGDRDLSFSAGLSFSNRVAVEELRTGGDSKCF